MFPILVSFGFLKIYSFGLFIILAWLTFSFAFWRVLKNEGVAEEKIFDLTFYGSLTALVASRITYVLLNWPAFSDSLIKVAAVWTEPGFSYYGALLGFLLAVTRLSRKTKIRLGLILLALTYALPVSFLVGSVGLLLDGAVMGKPFTGLTAIYYAGDAQSRYPVQLYQIAAMMLFLFLLPVLKRLAENRRYITGTVGIWYFMYFSVAEFFLEFLKDTDVYWAGLTVNQWFLIAIFCESVGLLFVKSGGMAAARDASRRSRGRINRIIINTYASFTRRFRRRHQDPA